MSFCLTLDPLIVIRIIENVKNSRGGRRVKMIKTLKINLSKIGWEGGGRGSTSIWIMSLNILGFFDVTPKLSEYNAQN